MELPEHERQKALVIWYVDRWLPIVAGQKCFGDKMRLAHYPAELVEVFCNEKKVLVPISTEAFGILNIDNCHEKWGNTCEWKRDDPKRKIPKKGPEAKQFRAKYTDSYVGQVKFGGWKPEAFPKYQAYIDEIKKGREVDEANGWKRQKYALELLRKKHNIAEQEAEAAAAASKRKKALLPLQLSGFLNV